jgi:hypothetical protein
MTLAFRFFIFLSLLPIVGFAQERNLADFKHSKSFSLGMRSTISLFSDDGTGIGSGGQFRIQPNANINTDWFADYILINQSNLVKSEYIHIGWSVLFYPFKAPRHSYSLQGFLLAGHCFDYNQKTLISNTAVNKHRWGAAPQLGVGCHFWLTDRADITLISQYMVHLTKEIELVDGSNPHFELASGKAFEGHWLNTLSVNYKIFAR